MSNNPCNSILDSADILIRKLVVQRYAILSWTWNPWGADTRGFCIPCTALSTALLRQCGKRWRIAFFLSSACSPLIFIKCHFYSSIHYLHENFVHNSKSIRRSGKVSKSIRRISNTPRPSSWISAMWWNAFILRYLFWPFWLFPLVIYLLPEFLLPIFDPPVTVVQRL